MGHFPPGWTNRKSVGAKETFAKKERPCGPILVPPVTPTLSGHQPGPSGCHTRSAGQGVSLGQALASGVGTLWQGDLPLLA